jgi:hypothetical protein
MHAIDPPFEIEEMKVGILGAVPFQRTSSLSGTRQIVSWHTAGTEVWRTHAHEAL